MNKKITLYYTTIALLLLFQVVSTVFQGSTIVGHGKKIAQTESQITALTAEKRQLTAAITQESSLITVASSVDMSVFTPIQSPLVISVHTTVASAQ